MFDKKLLNYFKVKHFVTKLNNFRYIILLNKFNHHYNDHNIKIINIKLNLLFHLFTEFKNYYNLFQGSLYFLLINSFSLLQQQVIINKNQIIGIFYRNKFIHSKIWKQNKPINQKLYTLLIKIFYLLIITIVKSNYTMQNLFYLLYRHGNLKSINQKCS